MKYDKALNAARVFFILSCVMAHCSLSYNEMANDFERLIYYVWSFGGCIGVPCFFITSGLLFKRIMPKVFIRKKLLGIVIPWLFCGTIVYFISSFPKFTILSYVQFVLGNGSFLYYIPMLLVCYTVFYIIPQNKICLGICILVTPVSLMLTEIGIINNINNFLNIFNWIGYFALGYVIARKNLLQQIRDRRVLTISIIGCLISIVIAVAMTVESYFHLCVFVAIPFFFVAMYKISVVLFEKNMLMQSVGKYTFTIYLLHMPVAALLKRVVRSIFPPAYVILPVVVIAIVYIGLAVYEIITAKCAKINKLSKTLLGLR